MRGEDNGTLYQKPILSYWQLTVKQISVSSFYCQSFDHIASFQVSFSVHMNYIDHSAKTYCIL